MGILEFHFHDSEFRFAPSVTGATDERSTEEGESRLSSRVKRRAMQRATTEAETESSRDAGSASSMESSRRTSTAKKGARVLLGLAFLVGMSAFAKRMVDRRRGGPSETREYGEERVEEEIEIAD